MNKPTIQTQINFIERLRKECATNRSGGAIVWRDDENMLKHIAENLIAIRNLELAEKKGVSNG